MKAYWKGLSVIGDETADALRLATAKQPKAESGGGSGGIIGLGIAAVVAIIAWPHIKRWT